MSKIRDAFKKIIKESKLLEGSYDWEHNEYYPDEGELVPHDDETFIQLEFPVTGHEALLDAMRKAGYTKENDWDPLTVNNGNNMILLEDAFVKYEVEVDQYGDYEYIESIYSVSIPAITPSDSPKISPFKMNYDNLIDITEILSKEDLAYVKQKLENTVELNEKPEEYDKPRVL